jgi:hypothetical protein
MEYFVIGVLVCVLFYSAFCLRDNNIDPIMDI